MSESTTAGIDGVRIIELTTHADDRGAMTETFRRSWFVELPPLVQANLSVSRAGVLRGLHFHRVQADYWCFLEGSAFIGLFDLRPGSPTEHHCQTIEVDSSRELAGVYVPPGVAHGFYAVTDVKLQYLVDTEFTGDDEFGFAWDDADAAVPWPVNDPILSDRDRAAATLAESLGDPPFYPG